MAHFAAKQGGNLEKLIQLSGKSADELCDEECKLGSEAYNAGLEAAVEESGDELFGLHAGENLNLQAAGLIVQIAHSSNTVKQALEYCCEFANLGCSALPTLLVEEKDYFKLTLHPDPLWLQQSEISVQHTIYGYLAFTIREFQSLTHNKHWPIEIWLGSQPPKNLNELQLLLGCPLRFNQKEIALLFDKQHVEEKVITSDYALLQVLVSHAQEKLKKLHVSNDFYETVKRSVINLVTPDFPTVEQVAAHLNMSVRTFQRKLKHEGHSYKVLIDELKKDFSLSYLKKPELSISDIAYLLNYADASAFVRSFKRWTGMTPKTYRLSL
ncbi:AraC family transcriptional regulator [Xanthovirga aplysinae]|uniref:AraC family transcriptional regulator n=1 Tax=Xanthovirga aplysinae TaxID=2529853 RepID=UPI00165726E8|nr:AraC family transcriptional regulator [Xanthovirga aplysinae]